MSDHAFVFVGTYTLKPGALDEWVDSTADYVRFVEEAEPQLLYFTMHLDEERRRATVVQVHPDADSMVLHIKAISDHIEESMAHLEPGGRHLIFGDPSDELLAIMEQVGGPDDILEVHRPFDGFSRLRTT